MNIGRQGAARSGECTQRRLSVAGRCVVSDIVLDYLAQTSLTLKLVCRWSPRRVLFRGGRGEAKGGGEKRRQGGSLRAREKGDEGGEG